jgi:hypothetical protein
MRDYLSLHLDTNKVKKHERLSNITLRHKIKVKKHEDYLTLHLDTK